MAEVKICIYPSGYSLSGPELAEFGATHRYTTAATMESGEDIDWVTATDNPTVVVLGGDATYNWSGNPDTDNVTMKNWDLSATYYLLWTTRGSARSSTGLFDTTAYILQEDGDKSLYCEDHDHYAQYEGLQFEQTGTTGSNIVWARYLSNWEFKNCYFKYSASVDVACASCGDITNADLIRFWNCVFNGGTYGVVLGAADTVNIYNCTFFGQSAAGVRAAAGTFSIYNSAIFNTDNDYYGNIGDYNAIDYCATDDNDIGTNGVDISPGGTEADDWNAAFTDYSNGDVTILNDSSVLYNAGNAMASHFTDLTGDTNPLLTDMIGNTRTRWDIGAFEYQAAGGANAPTGALQGPLFGPMGGPI